MVRIAHLPYMELDASRCMAGEDGGVIIHDTNANKSNETGGCNAGRRFTKASRGYCNCWCRLLMELMDEVLLLERDATNDGERRTAICKHE